MALTYGAWISQDHVRKANRGGLCFGHTDTRSGCEVGPENYGITARNLKLDYDEWDFTQPAPQARAFKRWIKSHLVRGEPVMWAPMLKTGGHTLYGRVGVPGNGHFDHHEPIIGIGSKHDLSDPEVYEDDWLVHYSDYDMQPCYRHFSSLEDDADMQGNCRHVRKNKSVMFPCFYDQVTYGLAIRGLSMFGTASNPRVYLDVNRPDEPRVRLGHPAAEMRGIVTVQGVQPGVQYVLYRFNSTEALPDGLAIDLLDMTYQYRYSFKAETQTWSFEDPRPINSDSATYYVAIPAGQREIEVTDSLKQRVPRAFLAEARAFGSDAAELRKDVRPTRDRDGHKLSSAPLFKSLAERPFGLELSAVALLSVAVAIVAAVIVTNRQHRKLSSLDRPALG